VNFANCPDVLYSSVSFVLVVNIENNYVMFAMSHILLCKYDLVIISISLQHIYSSLVESEQHNVSFLHHIVFAFTAQ